MSAGFLSCVSGCSLGAHSLLPLLVAMRRLIDFYYSVFSNVGEGQGRQDTTVCTDAHTHGSARLVAPLLSPD